MMETAVNKVLKSIADDMEAAPPRREMGRDDRRIIFAKLNEVYVSDKTGYGPGWTDEKVASDLGVPRGWVKLIRDENFGDEMANEEIKQKVAEAALMLEEIKDTVARAEEWHQHVKRLSAQAEFMSKTLDTIRKSVGA